MSNIIKTGKVVYVEPNIAEDFTSYNSENLGQVYKSVNLEDMCIVVGLEVEVKGRTYRSMNNGNENNLELNWQSNSKGETISFMQGTKIPTADGGYVRSLTTNYTDCHLFDIENDGTTEMFGIKYIDINYNNFMVPEVTIQFIDVRGVSLFAQEEMRHHLSDNNGMTGLVDNSIEGSFFKCFFTFPYPKFTLKVKGFYGEMVSYELTCSDFRASFDSNTGNFNVTAKFVGYAFSFMGDVMVNGLVSAPYSDYVGKKYWEDNINNNRFKVENRNGKQVPMEKLGNICKMYKEIQQNVEKIIKDQGYEKTMEELGMSQKYKDTVKKSEIKPLQATYTDLMQRLDNIANGIRVNSDKQKSGDAAIQPSGKKSYAFITDYDQDSLDELRDAFTALNDSIAEYAKNFEVLNNWLNAGHFVRLDKYDDYGDIVDDNHNVKSDKVSEKDLRDAINKKAQEKPSKADFDYYYEAWEDYDDSTVYIYQDFDLRDILWEGAEISADNEKEVIKIREDVEFQLLNQEFNKVFGFEPSVENITKIVMAHVETFIAMISQCANNIINEGTNRSAGKLGIRYENFPDIGQNTTIAPSKDTIVPPFPKVTRTTEEDGVKKTEGEWIGKVLSQDKAEEIKLIEGLLFGISEASNDINKTNFNPNIQYDETAKSAIKYPLTYFDLFLEEGDKPFGTMDLSDVNSIFANMCVRAYSIMATQGENKVDAMNYGNVDAENFLEYYKNDSKLDTLSQSINNITSEKVLKFLTTGTDKIDASKKNNPWNRFKNLLTEVGTDKYRIKAGYLGGKHAIFPTKNWSFKELSEAAIQNDNNPKNGLRTKKLDHYVSTSSFDDSGNDFTENSQVIQWKESPIVYFKNTYQQLANSIYETESKVGTNAFATSNQFTFNYETWVSNYNTWQPFFDKAGNYKKYGESIEYDEAGSVKTVKESALDFHNLFINKEFLKKDATERAADFIYELFTRGRNILTGKDTVLPTDSHSFRNLLGLKPKVVYLGKFTILRDAVYFLRTTDKINLRPTIVRFYKEYFQDWAKTEYPKIEALYKIPFKTGCNIETLQKAVWSSNHTEEGILKVIGDNIEQDKLSLFNRLYKIVPLNRNVDGGVFLKTKPCSEMDEIIRDLMQIVGVCTTSKFNLTEATYNKTSADISLKKSQLESYFNGFIDVLKKNLQTSGNRTNDTEVKLINDPDDIKIGVYNYIKMLYDKWLASGAQDEFYKLEKMFDGSDPTFHFVDSAYNRIGKSIYLNLTTLVDRIVQSQTQNGYTLLSMLSGLYADNKFLFLCIQNFMDFGRDDIMEKMFRPIPYLDKEEPGNRPNFIVLMPYEPSTKLDVKGADYPDDGFYLNDESTWPEMIKSKPDTSLPIPAFGVCYGQQYQNYFKNISVDMNSPMTTEQSIKAKFLVAGAYSGDDNNGPRHITIGQDLYTIYSNNSYTCTVTMMGCAWVQPMMYFVLQNVPMFRGSYMIVKVNHQITPGNMITTFKGVRMANTATRSVKQFIYANTTDSVGEVGGSDSYSSNKSSYANTGNNCDYAYYSPTGSVIGVPSNADAQAYCYATYQSLVNAGLTEAQAKGVCANIKKESGFNPYIITIDGNKQTGTNPHHGVGGGLAGFYYHGSGKDLFRYVYGTAGQQKLDELNAKVEPYWKRNPVPCSRRNTKKMMDDGLKYDVPFEKQVEYLCHATETEDFNGIRTQTNESTAAWWWMEYYERPSDKTDRWEENGSWVNSAIAAGRKTVGGSGTGGAEEEKSVEEIARGLTQSINSSLRASQYYNQTEVSMEVVGNGYFDYKAKGTNATNALFDCLLSSYGKWFDVIRWCVGTTQANHDAISVRIHIVKTPHTAHDIAIYCSDTNGGSVLLINKKEQLNEAMRLILIKYFKTKNISTAQAAKAIFKSCTRMTDELVREVFELAEVKSIRDCYSVMGGSANTPNGVVSNAKLSEYYPNGVHSQAEAEAELVTFTVATGQSVKMHKKVKDQIISAFNEIKNNTSYNVTALNTFDWRYVRNGTKSNKLSNHAYGLAIDINDGSAGNPFFNTYSLPVENKEIPQTKPWPWGFKMSGGRPISGYYGEYNPNKCIWYYNHPVVKIMAKYGFGWGGRYGDTMHFSVFNGA